MTDEPHEAETSTATKMCTAWRAARTIGVNNPHAATGIFRGPVIIGTRTGRTSSRVRIGLTPMLPSNTVTEINRELSLYAPGIGEGDGSTLKYATLESEIVRS